MPVSTALGATTLPANHSNTGNNSAKFAEGVSMPGLQGDLWGFSDGWDALKTALDQYSETARKYALEDREYTAMREDTAIQRRVEDLKKAGLNPWLAVMDGSLGAAGSSASQVGAETIQGMQLAGSAMQVLAQYASLPSKNYKNLAETIKDIVKSLNPFK